jgi:hypothetical protein
VALKAVIFDFGDVLVRTVDYGVRAAWEDRLNLAPGQAEHIVFGGPKNKIFEVEGKNFVFFLTQIQRI